MIGDTLTTIQPQEHTTATTIKPDTAHHNAPVTPHDDVSADYTRQYQQHPATPIDAATELYSTRIYPTDSSTTAINTQQAAVDTTGGIHFTLPFSAAPDSTSTLMLGMADPSTQGGDPTIYSLRHDTTVGVTLVICFLLIVYALNRTQNQMGKIVRGILDNTRHRTFTIASLPEMRYLMLLIFCTAIETALVYYNITTTSAPDTSLTTAPIVGIYTAIAIVYLIVKTLVYNFINWVFFSKEQRSAWNGVYVLATSVTSLLLFPILIAQIYLELNANETIIALIVVLGILKLLEMSKAAGIFFGQELTPLHITIYLSVLEIIPIGALISILELCREYIVLEI